MSLVTSITVNGVALDLDEVLAGVVIRVGRGSFDEDAQASSASLTLLGTLTAFTSAFRVGDAIVITVETVPRFTGRITDAALADDHSADAGMLELTAVGTRARLGRELVGAVDWPQEAFSARVTRLFAELGVPGSLVLPSAAEDPVIAARVSLDAGGPMALDDALSELAQSVPLVAYDRGDGKIVVQTVSARGAGVLIDPSTAFWLYAPEWSQVDDVRNDVTVSAPSLALPANAVDTASVARFGLRSESIATALALDTEAMTRLYRELTQRSLPIWLVEQARLVVPPAPLPYTLPDVGSPVSIRDLPASAPAAETVRIVEGWEEHITAHSGELDRELVLFLSPPAWSRWGKTWATMGTLKWNTINPTYTWAENEGLHL